MQKKIERIIKELAVDHSLPEHVIKAVIESQFQCAREAVKKGDSGDPDSFLNIRFRHLGLLVAKPGKINKLHNIKQKKLNENE